MSERVVHLVVALAAEARPIASWFNLKREPKEHGFPVYRNQHISLVVSGIGKPAAAAATAHLHARNGCPRNAVWVNVGIAGHATRPIGEAILAHRITDQASGRHWYPPLCFEPPCPSESLLSVDRPAFDYDRTEVLEMEAAGFYPTACRFATSELVHCLKVVSDNRDQPGHQLDAAQAQQLIGGQLDTLDGLLAELGHLANQLDEARVPTEILAHYEHRWRFTVSQRHRLERLLERWQTLARSDLLWLPELAKARDARAVLARVEGHVETLPITFGGGKIRGM